MQTEKDFLQSFTEALVDMGIADCAGELLDNGYTLHEFYNRMHCYGFESPDEVMQSALCLENGMADLR